MNIFEYATREKVRFSFRGQLSVEDLWDLNPSQLDTIYKDLNSQLKKASEESLLQVKTIADKQLEVKIEIVKYIVKVKLEESEAKLKAKLNKERRQKIMEVLAAKEDQSLQNKSPEELQAMLNDLE